MRIAYTLATGRGKTNLLLTALVDRLAERGLRLAGTVQKDVLCDDGGRCDMDVKILPDGPVVRISQSLGKNSKGCRLDPDALERSVGMAEREIENGADLLIVNKFGKTEADGRGFREAIGKALAADIPVLVGASEMNVPALEAFCGDVLDRVEPDLDALETWVVSASVVRAG